MSAWAERMALAVEVGTLYVTSAEWQELNASAPASPRPTATTDLPIEVNDELATKHRRRAEEIVRADVARMGRFRIS